MVWIWVAIGVGLVGLVLIGWYLVVLYRKLGALFGELGVVADRAGEALDLVAQIQVPDDLGGRYDATFALDSDDELEDHRENLRENLREDDVDDDDADLTADAWAAAGARRGRRT